MPPWRKAEPGDLCTCGRPAREVFERADGGEVGYCGVPDGGPKTGPCPFCGERRHEIGPCPQYRMRPDSAEKPHDDSQTDGG